MFSKVGIRGFCCFLFCCMSSIAVASVPDREEAATEQQDDVAKPANLYEMVAKENLKSLVGLQATDQGGDVLNALISDEKQFSDVLYEKSKVQLNPNELIKRSAVFNLLCQRQLEPSKVLDEKTWQDLEMLCGPKSDPLFYLASKIDRAYTQMGKAALYCKLVNSINNIDELTNQQVIVKELVENTALFDELDKQLKKLVVPEHAMLSFWAEDTFYALLQEHKIKIPLFKKLEVYVNKNEFILEVNDKFDICIKCAQVAVTGVAAVTLPLYALALTFNNNNWAKWLKEKNDAIGIGGIGLFAGMIGALLYLIDKIHSNRWTKASASAAGGLSSGFMCLDLPNDIKDRIAMRKCVQERLIYVATYLNTMKNVITKVQANPVLDSRMPAVEKFHTRLADFSQTASDVQHLLNLLETDTFKGEASVASFTGRIYAAFKLMHQSKEQFVDAMLALGELDAQLSIAKLYKEFNGKRVNFCFPTYINPQTVDVPAVKILDFWNPFIDPEKVVPSSLEVGQPYGTPQNVIITGPNAGGKSTITKAFVIAVILAQSLGIAPAKELTLTPFAKIITYLNITDDIAAGNSHFKAGVLRAQDVEKTYQACKAHEFVLTAIDEVFNGTTFKEGQAAAVGLIYGLICNPLGMCITNTHFPLIPALEKVTGRVANYKVMVVEKPGEKIRYPFNLVPGISDQIVTLKILKEEGFGDTFLERAQQVLDGKFAVAAAAAA